MVAFFTMEKFLEKLMDIGNKNKTNIITNIIQISIILSTI